MPIQYCLLVAFLISLRALELRAQAESPAHEKEQLAGHSLLGEAFNEGPRQAAYLMPGMGSTNFPTSAKGEEAQAFMNQGVSQLHGFWYFEAERSFRQAAKLEPELAIAYWGMAMANTNNSERALGFIEQAEKRLENANPREQGLIRALAKYLKAGKKIEEGKPSEDEKKKRRREREEHYIDELEKILDDYPDDYEIMALVALQLWTATRASLPITSHYAVDGLLDRVFDKCPDHPAHHYRIHLWDNRRPKNALASAAACGPSIPGIAHMWHMPGHTYSKLNRYQDAIWQQYASARVDHAHMMRDHVMPDQIHNFAHNNEWLIRNLLKVGQVKDAVDLAQNLISLPRHPKYNSLDKGGSAKYGRERLIDTRIQYEQWNELIQDCDSPLLSESEHQEDSLRRMTWLIVALQFTDNAARSGELLRKLRLERIDLQRELVLASAPAGETRDSNAITDAEQKPRLSSEDRKKKQDRIKELRESIAIGAAAVAVRKKDATLLDKQLAIAGKIDSVLQADWLERCGKHKQALEVVRKAVKDSPGDVRPQAMLCDLLWRQKDQKNAKREFQKLRTLAATADLDPPLMQRMKPIAESLKLNSDWRTPHKTADDLGERPPLDSLGPKVWSPYPAPWWKAQSSTDEIIDSTDIEGHATILVFYLGFGCLHCVEQLQAFQSHLEGLERQGVRVIGISSEQHEDLVKGIKAYDKPQAIPLHSDSTLEAFKAFRCFDDFEQVPLHGTFLIDAGGRVRWQDISHEPFKDIEFLKSETTRLLALP